MLEPLLDIPSQIDFLSIGEKWRKKGLKSAYFIRKKVKNLSPEQGIERSPARYADDKTIRPWRLHIQGAFYHNPDSNSLKK